MEDTSIILLRVASHWWPSPLCRRSGNRQTPNQLSLKKSLHLKRKMLSSVYLGCQCEMHGAQK